MDLIRRIESLSDSEKRIASLRFKKWLNESMQNQSIKIEHENRFFSIFTLNSEEFNDIILEDSTEWFYIASEDRNFECICKILSYTKNFINEKKYPVVSASVWILKSDFENFKISKPTLIYSPHIFENPIEKIEKNFLQLLKKLNNEKVKIIELTGKNKINENYKQRIR
jgi:hypothetical protein